LYSNVNHLMKPGQQPMFTFLNAFDHKQQQFTCFLPQQENGIELELPYITNRQKQIINLLAQGRPSKEIAHILKISKNTVDNHRQRLLKKFNVSSSAELVVKSAGLY
jgi:DNA-binding CsgD family transcriptional regulator